MIPVRVCRHVDAEHARSLRAYAHVFCRAEPVVCVGSAFFLLPDGFAAGILAHELGHLVAGRAAGERQADVAFEEATGIRVRYRDGPFGRCLQWLPPTDVRRLLALVQFDVDASGAADTVVQPEGDDVRFMARVDGATFELASLRQAEAVAAAVPGLEVWAQEGRRRLGWRPLVEV